MTKSNLERKGFLSAYSATSQSTEGSQVERTQTKQDLEQQLMQRSWRGPAYRLGPHDWLSLFSYSTQGHQLCGGTSYSVELGPSTSIRKMPQAGLQTKEWGHNS